MPLQEASSRSRGRGPTLCAVLLLLATAVAASADPLAVTGRVLGEGGRGVPRAVVEVVPLAGPVVSPAPVATGASDAAGRFRLEVPGPGMWKVLARAGGYVPLEMELAPLVEPADLPPARLTAASPAEVKVLGMQGNPLAGAQVRAEPETDPRARPGWRPAARSAVADRDGVARLPRGEAEKLILFVGAGSHLETRQPWGASSTVRLEPCRERAIEVRGSSGAPLPGVEVQVLEGGSWTAADEQGRASVCVPAGRAIELAFASRGVPIGRRTLPPTREEDSSPAVFRLAAPPTASGQVVDSTSRRPLPGALVWPEGHAAAFVRTAADGRWTLPVPAESGGRVRAAAPGYRPAEGQVAGAPAPGPVLALSPRTSGERLASGLVVDESGQPVAGATVSLVPTVSSEADLLPQQGSAVSVRSGPQGTFEGRLREGTWDLRASAPGRVAAAVRGIVVPPGQGPVPLGTVVLRSGETLDGQVVDPEGEGLAGCPIRVLPGDDVTRFLAAGAEAEDTATVSEADGAFTLTGLLSGRRVTLRVDCEGYTSATLTGIEAPAEQPLRVTLSPVSRISGKVLDESGAPVTRAQVVAVREGKAPGGDGAAGPLDEDGGFVIENVAPGRFTLLVAAPGFLPARREGVEVAPGRDASGLELKVEKGATVEGRVTTAEGEPLPGARVRVEPGEAAGRHPLLAALGLAEAITGEDGSYRLEGVAEGGRSISAEAGNHLEAVQDLAVQPGTNHLDFRLAEGWEVSGRAVDPRGQPVPGAAVSLVSPSGVWPVTTGPDGGFRITGVPDGSYRLQAEKAGWAVARNLEKVRVTGGPVGGLVVQLDRGGTIAGRISGLGFDELSRVQVSANGPAGGQLGQVDYQGAYRIETLSAGDWIVEALDTGTGRRAVRRVRLEPGQALAELDLDFGGGR